MEQWFMYFAYEVCEFACYKTLFSVSQNTDAF
jgi:hypothetical protein